jgi:hypothetical protein
MIDADLAQLYGVTTKRLNEQVGRNKERFPEDFMFRLTWKEADSLRSPIATLNDPNGECLRSQIATSNAGRGGRRYRPYAFTEHGAIMAASVLKSEQAVKVSVHVVRAFVKLRQVFAAHRQLGRKLEDLERRLDGHDEQIAVLLAAIRELMTPPPDPPRKRIGFRTE